MGLRVLLRLTSQEISKAVQSRMGVFIRVVVKIMVPSWVLNIIRHLIFRVPQKGTIILTTTQYDSNSGAFGARRVESTGRG